MWRRCYVAAFLFFVPQEIKNVSKTKKQGSSKHQSFIFWKELLIETIETLHGLRFNLKGNHCLSKSAAFSARLQTHSDTGDHPLHYFSDGFKTGFKVSRAAIFCIFLSKKIKIWIKMFSLKRENHYSWMCQPVIHNNIFIDRKHRISAGSSFLNFSSCSSEEASGFWLLLATTKQWCSHPKSK